MKFSTAKLGLIFAIHGSIAVVLNAELTFTEQAVVTEVRPISVQVPTTNIALGDALTITYRIQEPSADPFGDPGNVLYNNVDVSVTHNGDLLFSNPHEDLTVEKLVDYFGVTVIDFDGPFLDFLISSSSDVINHDFIKSGVPLSDFFESGGSLLFDDTVIGFSTQSYSVSGQLPLSSVPEASTFGISAATVLLGLATFTLISRRTLGIKTDSVSSSMR